MRRKYVRAATLSNDYTGQYRQIAATLNVVLGGGMNIDNWRAGYTTFSPGGSYGLVWNQDLPALVSTLGGNRFLFAAEDVTPVPYNLPPYPPAGDTDSSSCTVTGNAP